MTQFNYISVLLPPLPFEKRNVTALRKEFSAGTYSDHMVLLRAFQVPNMILSEHFR